MENNFNVFKIDEYENNENNAMFRELITITAWPGTLTLSVILPDWNCAPIIFCNYL